MFAFSVDLNYIYTYTAPKVQKYVLKRNAVK